MISLVEHSEIINVGGRNKVCFACSVRGKEGKQDNENLGNGKAARA